MIDALIISAVRTAVGKAPKGTLRNTRPDETGAVVIKEAIARVEGLDPAEIEDVIMGCAMPEAEQGMNVARSAAIRARWRIFAARPGSGRRGISTGRRDTTALWPTEMR